MNLESTPVTILTGFLGSGKTTLLNKIIKAFPQKRFAIIENEFGAVPIDNELVVKADQDLFTLENGCICCSLQSDILDILIKLKSTKHTIDHVLIESTGMADPAPVAQLFINNMDLQQYYKLDGVICLVDAINYPMQVAHQPEAVKQLVMADQILISKIEKVTDDALTTLREKIRALNKTACIDLANELSVEKLLEIKAYDLKAVEKSFAPVLSFSPVQSSMVSLPFSPHKHDHSHHHHDIQTFSMQFKGGLDFIKFNNWFNFFIATQGHKLYRTKGILHSASSDKKIIFQSVHHEIDGMEGNPWGDEPRESKMVFIGRDLDEKNIRKEVLDCIGALL
jgi:G3E family GTPase